MFTTIIIILICIFLFIYRYIKKIRRRNVEKIMEKEKEAINIEILRKEGIKVYIINKQGEESIFKKTMTKILTKHNIPILKEEAYENLIFLVGTSWREVDDKDYEKTYCNYDVIKIKNSVGNIIAHGKYFSYTDDELAETIIKKIVSFATL